MLHKVKHSGYIFGLCEDFYPKPYLILMPRAERAC